MKTDTNNKEIVIAKSAEELLPVDDSTLNEEDKAKLKNKKSKYKGISSEVILLDEVANFMMVD